MHEIAAKLDQLKESIYTDFPADVGEPVDTTLYSRVDNFLRNGPYRKVVAFATDGVDFEYDDDAGEGDDVTLEIAMRDAFDQVLEEAVRVLGAPLGHRPLDMSCVMDVDDDDDFQGESCDDTEWSPEYQQGALLEDTERTRYWFINGRNVFLQASVLTGDNDIVGVVAMTVTPLVGDAEPTGYWPPVAATLMVTDEQTKIEIDDKPVTDFSLVERLNFLIGMCATLPDLLYQMPRLEELTLPHVGLSELRFPLASFVHLRTLSIDGNRDSDLAHIRPATRCVQDLIAQALGHVTTLTIRGFGNRCGESLALTELRGISQWRSLTSLDLRHNQLTFTPAEFDDFIAELRQLPLEELDLIGNETMEAAVPGDLPRTFYTLIRQALPDVRVRTSYS